MVCSFQSHFMLQVESLSWYPWKPSCFSYRLDKSEGFMSHASRPPLDQKLSTMFNLSLYSFYILLFQSTWSMDTWNSELYKPTPLDVSPFSTQPYCFDKWRSERTECLELRSRFSSPIATHKRYIGRRTLWLQRFWRPLALVCATSLQQLLAASACSLVKNENKQKSKESWRFWSWYSCIDFRHL